jgi:uncharacterized membrane protein YhaH (DUF805 family)
VDLINVLRNQWPLRRGWSGISGKSEYWLGIGRCILVLVFGSIVMSLLTTYGSLVGEVVALLVRLFIFTTPIYMVRLSVRRLRDAGLSFWWFLFFPPMLLPLGLMPSVGLGEKKNRIFTGILALFFLITILLMVLLIGVTAAFFV